MSVLEELAATYPQLYLDPDRDDQEAYRRVVLRGEDPETRSLAHYAGNPADRLETVEVPAGRTRVVTLGDRGDFERVIRGLMAAKSGPLCPVPESQGAAMVQVFNWPRIKAHLAAFPEAEQAGEFRRFTSVRDNYVDMLIVLSRGPYSHVSAAEAGYPEDEWLEYSDTIRRFHELTHFICRRRYPQDIDAVRDELIADAVGLLAAFGRFDPELEKRFLGIRDGKYTGGRQSGYTHTPDAMVRPVCEALEQIRRLAGERERADPYDLIPVLMERLPTFG